MSGLATLADRDGVENVVVFVADSLRYDALPEWIAERGVTARTIAASTYTGSSIPSMMTGRYPADHRVWQFDDRLERPPALFEETDAGTDTRTSWVHVDDAGEKPPNRILGVDRQLSVEEATEPFTVVVHDIGAHAPYDFFDGEFETSGPFFEAHAGRRDELRRLYRRGVTAAAERFRDCLATLEERGVLDRTLVAFTSDHGELLGEPERGGTYAHGEPVCPELVEVPTVFLGAGLPGGRRLDGLASGVDLAPTLLGAQGRDGPDVAGLDLWNGAPPDGRIVRSDYWSNAGRVRYGASSAWSTEGGVVRHLESRGTQLAFALHRKLLSDLQAPANRRGPPRQFYHLLRTYGARELVFGAPDVERLRAATVERFERSRERPDEGVDEEHLRALGYVD